MEILKGEIVNTVLSVSSEIYDLRADFLSLKDRTDILIDYNLARMNIDRRLKFVSIAKTAEEKREIKKKCKRREQIARRREIRKRSGKV